MELAGNDNKKVWNTINELLNRTKNTENSETITENGIEITDKTEIANIFSTFY